MAEHIRGFDWSATSLGETSSWPTSLRTVIDLILDSPLPQIVLWGPDLIQIYNDSYSVVMGAKHPSGFAQPTSECWPEVWPFNRPHYEAVFEGKSVSIDDQYLPLERNGVAEPTWFDLTYSPMRDDAGAVGGVLVTTIEITGRKLAETAARDWETALAESEAQYRLLFDGIGDGFCVIEVLFDEHDRPFDYKFLKVNPAFERQTGLHDVVGKTILSMVPEQEPYWFEIYGRIVRTGQPEQFEQRAEALGRWYEVDATPVGEPEENQVAVVFRDVLERRKAEEALRESEERFRTMADNVPVLIWETDQDGATSVNRHYTDFFGVSIDEVLGMGWAKFLHPDDKQGYFDAYLDAFNRRTTYVYACRFLRADGQYRWLRNSGGPVGENRFAGCSLDVTDLLNAQEVLRESAERQRLTVELVPALLWSANPDGQEVTLNDGWTAFTGQSETETQDYGWLNAIHPDDLPATRSAFEHAFATGEPLERQQRIRKAGDGYRWHLVRHVPVRDENGAITRWFGAAVDIHDSKLAEQALQETERRLQTLVEGVPQLVWRAVGDGYWTWASPQWTAQTGQAEADSHGLGWLEPVHPDDRDRVLAVWGGAIERGEFHADYRICHQAEDRYRWFQTRATPVRDDRGEIIEWLGTSTDVDDLRGLQERQQVLVAELQHRTRNLMGVVRSTADRTGEASTDFADFRRRFHDRLEALARVQGLLSRLNEIDRIAFDELIRAELKAMNGAAERVTLDGPSGIRLRSSMVQTLAMALHELATNAVKYGALGQPDARLAIAWRMVEPDRRGRPRLRIEWRESGVTMPSQGASPQGGGQGRELIERALPYQLSAETSFELGQDGVRCTITMPVSASTSREVVNG